MPRPLPFLAPRRFSRSPPAAQPSYYLLPCRSRPPSRASPVGSVVVADLSLPAYADALEIASLTGPATVEPPKRSLWADTPRRAMTRHLAAALDERPRARVATEPWPGFDAPGCASRSPSTG